MLGKDVVMFNAAMGACEKASAWQNALCLFNESPSPDVISYNCLMSALLAERLAGMCKEVDRVDDGRVMLQTSGIFRLNWLHNVTPRLWVSSWHHLPNVTGLATSLPLTFGG